MKWKRATTARAGLLRGRMTRQKMPQWEQQSRRAASSSTAGMPRKNWRRRKMLKAPPNQAGTQRGLSDPIQWSFEKRTKSGAMRTGKGDIKGARREGKRSIMVGGGGVKRGPRPRKGMRAKP